MEEIDINLDFVFDPKHAKALKMRGVDGSLFAGRRNAFDLMDCVLRMRPTIRNMKQKSVGVNKQLRGLQKMLDRPFYGHKTMGIGSFPTDLHSKMVALNIMRNAYVQQSDNKWARPRQQPLWHKVFGGFPDKLRDNHHQNRPSFLVLSNIDEDSTGIKLEKVRDLLEIYHDVPKVVVVSGCDPIWFFANKLRMPLDTALYLGHHDRVPDADLLDL